MNQILKLQKIYLAAFRATISSDEESTAVACSLQKAGSQNDMLTVMADAGCINYGATGIRTSGKDGVYGNSDEISKKSLYCFCIFHHL